MGDSTSPTNLVIAAGRRGGLIQGDATGKENALQTKIENRDLLSMEWPHTGKKDKLGGTGTGTRAREKGTGGSAKSRKREN